MLAAIRRVFHRPPDFVIGDDYMLRWWVIPRNRWFNVYLHCIGRDDDDRALHDHPWWNISIILKGSYREITDELRSIEGNVTYRETRVREPGDIVFRRAEEAHRLEVVKGPVWSLFITGRRVREWGFHCPKGWVHWTDFTSDDGRSVGKGCGDS